MLAIDDTFQGKYRVKRLLGTGSFGAVYLVAHERLEESELALKVIRPPPAAALDYRRRFLQEVRIGCRLRSPHIVPVRDFDATEDGLLYFTMDRVPGLPLDEVIDAVDALPWPRALRIARQILVALEEAHAHAVIHRDIKPGNVLVEERIDGTDFVRVLDFGIARILGGDAVTRDWMGTPHYMAPEAFQTPTTIDGRADLYAVGVVLYELLVGQRPFRAQDPLEILLMHRSAAAVPPTAARPGRGIPPAVERLVMRALEKRPEARFQDAAAMIAAIDGVLAAEAPPATPAGGGPGASGAAPSRPLEPPPPPASSDGAAATQTHLPPVADAGESPVERAPVDRARLVVGARTDRIFTTRRLRVGRRSFSAPPETAKDAYEVDISDITSCVGAVDYDYDGRGAGADTAGAGAVQGKAAVCDLVLYGGRVCLRDTSADGVRVDGERVRKGALTFLPSRFRVDVPGTPLEVNGRVFPRSPGNDAPGALRLEPAGGVRSIGWVWLIDEASLGPEDGPIPLPGDDEDAGARLRSEEGEIHYLAAATADRFVPLGEGETVRLGDATLTAGT